MVKKSKAPLFKVEKIINERQKEGKSEFLVKWEGYKGKDNSWEPERNLVYCKDPY